MERRGDASSSQAPAAQTGHVTPRGVGPGGWAVNICGTTGCRVVTTFTACLGLGYSSPTQGQGVWPWVEATMWAPARQEALNECERPDGLAREVLNVVCLDATDRGGPGFRSGPPPAPLRLRYVTPNPYLAEPHQRLVAVVPLVGDHLFDPRTVRLYRFSPRAARPTKLRPLVRIPVNSPSPLDGCGRSSSRPRAHVRRGALWRAARPECGHRGAGSRSARRSR